MRLIQEERGATVATHVYEPGSYVPLARIDSHTVPAALGAPAETTTAVYYLHNNINGAPEEMTDARGALIWQARYAVWGNTVAEHWHREHRPDPSGLSAQSPLPQNLRMQGQYADQETGLCYNTFRYYDPDIGRFISQDPIGLAGGMNLYQYAPNPISWIDPWGWNKNSNNTVGDWVLYDVIDPKSGRAKTGIGKAEDVMANGKNRRAEASARKVRKDPKFPDAKATIVSEHKGITKGAMKEIEAARVRELRSQGHELPHNRENDRRYKQDKKGGKSC